VPEDEILEIRPLMTMVGGKVIALNASLATEWGTDPLGHQFTFEDTDVEWIGKAFSEQGKKEAGVSPE
jgi:hypothetical protein